MTVVKHIADSHDASGLNTGRQEVLYGTHNGVLGQLFLDHQTAKQGFVLKSSQHKGKAMPACCLDQNAACLRSNQLLLGHIHCWHKATMWSCVF